MSRPEVLDDPDRDEYARRAALHVHGADECEIDADARVVFLDEPGTGDEGSAWVQAWVLVPADSIEFEIEYGAIA